MLDSFINLPMYSANEPKSMELIGPTGEGFGYTVYKGKFLKKLNSNKVKLAFLN